MATTFTILAVFLPVGFMTGIVGQFFKSFALTIAFAVGDVAARRVHARPDAVVAVRALHPARGAHADARWAGFFERIGAPATTARSPAITRMLGWALDGPWTVVAMAGAVFVASLSTDRGDRHGVRARRRSRRVRHRASSTCRPGTSFEQSVAQHVDRSSRRSAGFPKSARCSAPSACRASPLGRTSRCALTKKDQRDARHRRDQGRTCARS